MTIPLHQARIMGVGDSTLDYVFRSPELPRGGSAAVVEYKTEGGGLTATAIVAGARLGARAELFCRLGADEVGGLIVSGLAAERVEVSRIYRAPGGRSPVSFVHVDADSGERTIAWFRDPSLKGEAGIPRDWRLEGFSCLLADATWIEAAISSARAARKLGIPVIADVVPSEANGALVSLVDILIAPASFARGLGQSGNYRPALDAVHALGPSVAVITLGKEGCWYSERGAVGHGPAFEMAPVVDTTGAGDVFHGAFAFATAQGWEVPRRVEFASAVAALKCRRLGGRAGIPSLEEALAFLRENGSMDWTCGATPASA